MHIGLVQKYANKIATKFPELKEVVNQAKNHDKSKRSNPEFDAYVELNWYFHNKHQGNKVPYNTKWHEATAIHVNTNSHHPEYHDPKAKGKSVGGYVVNAYKMPEIDMAEMCADLCAMAKKLGGTPQDFYKENINKRWKFTKEQQTFMINIFNEVW